MPQQIDQLARKALAHLKSAGGDSRVIIGIAGVPGSGKTTIANAVASRINEISHDAEYSALRSSQDGDFAVAVPMDGFHFSREHLAGMPNPKEAIHRRGAAFTFDGEGFLSLVRLLRDTTDKTVYAPSFHHEIKDPVPNSIPIYLGSKVVLIEGNYCALNEAPWKDAAALMTLLWYVDCSPEVAHSRLAKRHLESGIVKDEKEAWERATGTDEMNAQAIRNNLLKVDDVIKTA